MKTEVPPAVHQFAGASDTSDLTPWYALDLTVDELSDTVQVINQAIRASRA